MLGLAENKALQERWAEKELVELRADTVKGLRYEYAQHGETGIVRLMVEAGIVPASAMALRPLGREGKAA